MEDQNQTTNSENLIIPLPPKARSKYGLSIVSLIVIIIAVLAAGYVMYRVIIINRNLSQISARNNSQNIAPKSITNPSPLSLSQPALTALENFKFSVPSDLSAITVLPSELNLFILPQAQNPTFMQGTANNGKQTFVIKYATSGVPMLNLFNYLMVAATQASKSVPWKLAKSARANTFAFMDLDNADYEAEAIIEIPDTNNLTQASIQVIAQKQK